MNEKLKSAGTGLLGLLGFILLLFVVVVVINGLEWVSDKVLPLFSVLSVIAFLIELVVLLPLSAIRKTRNFAAVAFFCVSYLFGATAWMEGLLTTLGLWGAKGVIIGLVFAGVGIVPVGILAALFHRLWSSASEMVVLVFLTFASRMYAAWLLSLQDKLRLQDGSSDLLASEVADL